MLVGVSTISVGGLVSVTPGGGSWLTSTEMVDDAVESVW